MSQRWSARHTVCAKVFVVLRVSVLDCHFVVEVGSNILGILLPTMNALVIIFFCEINAQRADADFAVSLAARRCLPTRGSRHCVASRSMFARSVLTPEMQA